MKSTESNIPALSVDNVIEQLSSSYTHLINNGISPKAFPSVMLWGPPGVGKSQAVRQIGKNIETTTGKTVVITDVRLLLFNPIDLRGIPTANAEKTLAIWLKPQIFQMNPNDDIVNILFLDEISAAPQSVQAAAYQITLDRVVGEHKLPDNCIVLAAGNRTTDKSVAFKMPKALANRLLHLEVKGSLESWLSWAARSNVNSKVMGFLSCMPEVLFEFDASNDSLAFSTPRSWEMVSNILNNITPDVEKAFPLISGLVGLNTANLFKAWCKTNNIPRVEDIFNGTETKAPQSQDILYVVLMKMVEYAKTCQYDVEKIGHSLEYAKAFPADYIAFLLKGYENNDSLYKHNFLMRLPQYLTLVQKCGVYRNGEIE